MMFCIFERSDSMKAEPRRSAPNYDVAMAQFDAFRFVGAVLATEQKDRRNAERYRYDRLGEILLVFVLMKREPRAGLIAIDEASIGKKVSKTCLPRCVRG